jgi:hypothetical protein
MQNGQVPRPSIRFLTTPSNVVLTPGNPRGLVALVLHQADPTIQRLLGSIMIYYLLKKEKHCFIR